ncbi:MAG TPA: TIM barrel protein [Armatimonadota bacterium]|jgi:hydroxypyruvate isomerase
MNIDVCLETVFTDQPVERRIELIAQIGYPQVEFWMTSGKDPVSIRQACAAAGVTMNDFVVNGPDGPFNPIQEGNLRNYLDQVETCIAFGEQMGCRKMITCSGNLQPGKTRAEMRATLEKALGEAAAVAEKHGFTLLLEVLNTHVDHAGYYLDSSQEGAEIVRAINSPGLKLLYDIYHMQIMEGNLIANIERHLDVIGHFHSAGVPGRHELFTGEIYYPAILERIVAGGYTGSFGLEYMPAMADHAESLRKTLDYLTAKPVC